MKADEQTGSLEDANAARADLVLVCPHLGKGGVQHIVSTLANAWSHRGYRVAVATLYRDARAYDLGPGVRLFELPRRSRPVRWLEAVRARVETHERRSPLGSRVCPMPARQRETTGLLSRLNQRLLTLYPPLWIRARALGHAIDELRPHAVISFCGSTNVTSVLACRGKPYRLIISERNDPSRQVLHFPWNHLRTRFYNEADVVTANSQGALRAMEPYIDGEKLAYVPNPSPRDPDAEPIRRVAETATILTVGRLHRQKAQDVLLQAFARLPRELCHWRLAMVGKGERQAALQALSERLRLSDRVDWYGQVDSPHGFYAGADIFVLPSRCEGTPNALLEAMAHGLPAIVTDASPGPLDLIRDGVNGLVVPVEDAAALARAIERLARDPELRARLGRAAREAAGRFDLESVLQKWQRLAGLRPPRPAKARGADRAFVRPENEYHPPMGEASRLMCRS